MDAIERAIRSAFEKGNAEDKAFRERVYRKAFAALERGLEANPGLTVEAAINRRKALQGKITDIESEFIPAVAALDTTPEPTLDDDDSLALPNIAPEPSFAAPDIGLSVPAIGLDPADSYPVSSDTDDNSGSLATAMRLEGVDNRARKRRRPFAIFFIVATLAALLGIGAWWGVQTGLFQSAEERDTSVPNPPRTVEGEDFIPEQEEPPVLSSETDPQRAWITIFSPADATQISAPADATAEMQQDESGSFLRVRSGASGAAIVFDVGEGVLEQLSGKSATFDVVARAEEAKDTEMAIECNFGELGDCGRKRYAVGYARGDYLFEVAFPATPAGAGGTIAINSDFSNAGKAVDIYEIRVSVAP